MKNSSFKGYACFSKKLNVARFVNYGFNDLLILESDPEQGYFFGGKLPEEMPHANDHHLYLVVRKTIPCFQDKIIRHAFYLRNIQKTDFHISPGQIQFENEAHSCIRIRINELKLLHYFIDDLEEMGIEFFYGRKYRRIKPYTSLVQFKKYIDLEEIEENVYREKSDAKIHLVKIPTDIDFSVFETTISDIKNNCHLNSFDTALVYFNKKEEVANFIALYSPQCNEEKLSLLAEFLDKEILRITG